MTGQPSMPRAAAAIRSIRPDGARALRNLAVLLCLLSLAGCASYEIGHARLEAGDPASAAEAWRAAARFGDTQSSAALADLYRQGEGVPRDDAEAARLYARAARSGDPWALHALAGIHADPTSALHDDAEAARLYRQAAKGGVVWSDIELGQMILSGRVPAASPDEGVVRLRAAAEKGEPYAQVVLAEALSARGGVPAQREAVLWFERAAEAGSLSAMLSLGGANPESTLRLPAGERAGWLERAAALIEPGAETAAQRRAMVEAFDGVGRPGAAAAMLRTLAEEGDAQAQYDLGLRLAAGKGVARDQAAATRWVGMAARSGIPWAQYDYAARLAQGLGSRQDSAAAARWYAAASRQGVVAADLAQADLGTGPDGELSEAAATALLRAASRGNAGASWRVYRLMLRGDLPGDRADALRHLERAAQGGDPAAVGELGKLLIAGDGLPVDEARGLALLETAARANSTDAQYNLAAALYRGGGGEGRMAEAWLWFDAAAEAGDSRSIVWRERAYERVAPEARDGLAEERERLRQALVAAGAAR